MWLAVERIPRRVRIAPRRSLHCKSKIQGCSCVKSVLQQYRDPLPTSRFYVLLPFVCLLSYPLSVPCHILFFLYLFIGLLVVKPLCGRQTRFLKNV